MKHARLVCNQKEKFQCAECRKLTSNGYQLIGDEETKFVCKDCYVNTRTQYPTKGKSIKHLLPADLIFSDDYDPSVSPDEAESVSNETGDTGYIGELVPDGNGGWREPTADEIRAMNARNASDETSINSSEPIEAFSSMTIKYRFTTDNKLQVVLPKRCRIDDRTYELIVTTGD